MSNIKLDFSMTKEEDEEFKSLKSRLRELNIKEKRRLAVLQRLWDETNGGTKVESVASKERKDLGQTKDDHYREGSKRVFSGNEEADRACRYEYTSEIKTAESGKNQEFEKKVKIKALIKDVEQRCEFAETLLNKRDLTPDEENELKALKIKKDSHRADYDEDIRFGDLNKIRFVRPEERQFAQFIKGIEKCFYYKDAHRTLKPGTSFREWNMDVSTSKEPADIVQVCPAAKHVSIGVFEQDPLDYAVKLKKVGQNPIVVVDASRMGPGGCWSRGDEGIEEQVFLRSTISLAVDKEISDHFYPMRNEALIYVPKIMVFRQNRATEYKVISDKTNPDFQPVMLCSGAVVKQTNIVNDEAKECIDERPEQEIYMEKIKNCLATACFHGYDSVVFTALGCYTYEKNFTECADAFLYAIFDPATKYYKRFRSIIFCVPPDVFPPIWVEEERLENNMLRKVKRLVDRNKDLYGVLTNKLQQITVNDVIFSEINLNTRELPKKPVISEAFSSLKL